MLLLSGDSGLETFSSALSLVWLWITMSRTVEYGVLWKPPSRILLSGIEPDVGPKRVEILYFTECWFLISEFLNLRDLGKIFCCGSRKFWLLVTESTKKIHFTHWYLPAGMKIPIFKWNPFPLLSGFPRLISLELRNLNWNMSTEEYENGSKQSPFAILPSTLRHLVFHQSSPSASGISPTIWMDLQWNISFPELETLRVCFEPDKFRAHILPSDQWVNSLPHTIHTLSLLHCLRYPYMVMLQMCDGVQQNSLLASLKSFFSTTPPLPQLMVPHTPNMMRAEPTCKAPQPISPLVNLKSSSSTVIPSDGSSSPFLPDLVRLELTNAPSIVAQELEQFLSTLRSSLRVFRFADEIRPFSEDFQQEASTGEQPQLVELDLSLGCFLSAPFTSRYAHLRHLCINLVTKHFSSIPTQLHSLGYLPLTQHFSLQSFDHLTYLHLTDDWPCKISTLPDTLTKLDLRMDLPLELPNQPPFKLSDKITDLKIILSSRIILKNSSQLNFMPKNLTSLVLLCGAFHVPLEDYHSVLPSTLTSLQILNPTHDFYEDDGTWPFLVGQFLPSSLQYCHFNLPILLPTEIPPGLMPRIETGTGDSQELTRQLMLHAMSLFPENCLCNIPFSRMEERYQLVPAKVILRANKLNSNASVSLRAGSGKGPYNYY